MGGKRIALTSQDLILFEHALKDEIASFIDFSSYSLYFPQEMPYEMRDPNAEPGDLGMLAIHLPKERKLLLPLAQERRFLGVFQARGVKIAAPKSILPFLTRMASLCLDKLAMGKRSITDPVTGLETRHSFLKALEREIDAVRDCMRPGSTCADLSAPVYRAGLTVLSIHVTDLEQLQKQYGYIVADRMLSLLGDVIENVRPKQVHAAHYAEGRFTLFIPEAIPNACRKLAQELAAQLCQVRYLHEITDERLSVSCNIGQANYPQDMEGALFERSVAEQARLLLQKGAKAANVAQEQGPGAIFPYARILEQGGRVKEVLPINRLLLSVGRDAGAREGQRFLVWSPSPEQQGDSDATPPLYKGEVALMEVLDRSSLAEIMHQGDPTWEICPGDRLTLLKESLAPASQTGSAADQSSTQRDMLTGLLLYRDFLMAWTKQREHCQDFTLALLRLGIDDATLDHTRAEQQAVEAATLAKEFFSPEFLGGRYSLTSLLLFHPGMSGPQAQEQYNAFVERLRKLDIHAAAGLACHPFLHFRKADALENCRKALDYALLLPQPHVGLTDSLALNISADKLFSQGDLYGAVEEYKLALLADENNTLAQNSLGICMARMGQLQQARQHFENVLRRNKKDVMALYNLGFVLQRMGEASAARETFKRCLKAEPEHIYSLIRLGQLAEQQNRLTQARTYYNKAAAMEQGAGVTQRYLARLSIKQGRVEEARERLHQALRHDPQDAFSMHLLAQLYLDNNEDPSIAETLARQSVSLRPESSPFWLVLARAYEMQGKNREAKEAYSRAGDR